jgi:2'-5' RNA ligase
MELPHKEPQKEYQPHVTIAYVKLGMGKDLAQKLTGALRGERASVTSLTFSGKLNEKREIPLTGQRRES